jgi:hypothetical protein
MRALLAATCLLAAALAQVPATTTSAEPELPGLGEPAPLPEGAPACLAAITRQALQKDALWLADDARAGRFTGSTAQQATARYVQERFQQLGLKPLGDKKGFLQSYPVEAIALDPASGLTIAGARITDVAVLPSSATDKVNLSGRIAFCGKGRGDEIPGALKGRIPVCVFDKVPRGTGPGGDLAAIQRYVDLARQLAKSEATAGVVVLPGDPGSYGNALNYGGVMPDHMRLSAFGGGRSQNLSIPLLVVGGKSASAVLTAIGATVLDDGTIAPPPQDSKVAGKLSIVLKAVPKGSASNVVAVLEGGSRKQEAIVFSAHHDHIGRRVDGDPFNGADDNASGTAGLLAIALAFSKAEKPARSIVFLSVSGEELGLWGSRWYAEHPTWPLDRIVANVNIDMIGRAEADGTGTKLLITPSKGHNKYSSIGRTAAQLAKHFEITFSSGDQYYTRSDHFNFAQKGVPVVFFCDGEHPDYHQVTDHADKLDYVRMEAIARLAGWTGWVVAESKEKPKELGTQAEW